MRFYHQSNHVADAAMRRQTEAYVEAVLREYPFLAQGDGLEENLEFDSYPARQTMWDITKAIANRAGISMVDIRGAGREKRFVEARHAAFMKIRKTLGRSLPEIGKFFNRDHSTVMYALRKMEGNTRRYQPKKKPNGS